MQNKLSNSVKPTIIFDLDGTLADNSHRQHFLDKEVKDWNSFFNACPYDEVFMTTLTLYKALHHTGWFEIVICTGRPETIRSQTEIWLIEKAKLAYSELIMRPEGNYEPDYIVKKKMLDELRLRGKEILFCVDDRPDVVKMWRENNVACFQVDDTFWIERQVKDVSKPIA